MSTQTLDIMDIRKGHETINFDPEDNDDLKRVSKILKEKLDKGFYIFGQKKDGSHVVIRDAKKVNDEDITEFLVSDMKKRVISPPPTGG